MAGGPMAIGRPGEAPAVAGTDFIIARDGRIATVYLFFDKHPELDSAAQRVAFELRSKQPPQQGGCFNRAGKERP